MGSEKAFTMTEMLMTVVIIGVMAAILIPRLERTLEHGRWRAARDILETIYAGERVRFTATNAYCSPTAATCTWADIRMDAPNPGPPVQFGDLPVQFTIVNGVNTFTATANRNGGTPCKTWTLTINELGVFGGANVNVTTVCP